MYTWTNVPNYSLDIQVKISSCTQKRITVTVSRRVPRRFLHLPRLAALLPLSWPYTSYYNGITSRRYVLYLVFAITSPVPMNTRFVILKLYVSSITTCVEPSWTVYLTSSQRQKFVGKRTIARILTIVKNSAFLKSTKFKSV